MHVEAWHQRDRALTRDLPQSRAITSTGASARSNRLLTVPRHGVLEEDSWSSELELESGQGSGARGQESGEWWFKVKVKGKEDLFVKPANAGVFVSAAAPQAKVLVKRPFHLTNAPDMRISQCFQGFGLDRHLKTGDIPGIHPLDRVRVFSV